MNNLFRTCALLFLLASCNSLPPLPAMLTPSKLPSQLLEINTERDTTLTLTSGAIITIPAYALKAANGKIAKLEVKEALTIEQMLVAGLRTKSNGTPLQSGGMVYINAANDAKVSILKPLQIQLPTNELVDGMQLYKGEVEKNGINWVDPQPLPAKPDTSNTDSTAASTKADPQNGKALFQQNCASCHNVHKQVTGPALKDAMTRWNNDTATLYSFVRNSSSVIASGHSYANNLFNQFGKQLMPAFPSLTTHDINDIFEYMDKQVRSDLVCHYPAPTMPDSCQYYSTIFNLASEAGNDDYFITIRDTLLSTGSQLLTTSDIKDTLIATAFKNLVTPKFNRSFYYTVDINTFGWYNIDMALNASSDLTPSELTVSISEKDDQSISVFLAIPSHKIMAQGGYLKDGKLYGFDEEDGTIPLPQDVKAYIIAIGENKSKPELYFGRTSFITSGKQALSLTLETVSEKDIQKQIAGLQLPDFLSQINKKDVSAQKQALGQEALRIQAEKEYCDYLAHIRRHKVYKH